MNVLPSFETNHDVEVGNLEELRERRGRGRRGSVGSTFSSIDDDVLDDDSVRDNAPLLSHEPFLEEPPLQPQLQQHQEQHQEQQHQRAQQPQKVTWSSLPQKSQLAILTLARLSEPLTQTSLQSYMFYQLKSFPGNPSDSTVAKQAGFLAAAFTGAQFLTAILWGRLADHESLGRKRVILIGLLGSMVGSLGFGFSRNFGEAVMWRAVGGVLNGNVGVMRTMISEIVKEKKFQSRAFLLMPMTFNIGVIIGPLLGGLLADPAGSYPGLFGPGGTLGGEGGVGFFMKWPYALPNLVNAVFLGSGALAVVLGLEETLEMGDGGRRDDWGLRLSRWIGRKVFRKKATTSGGDYAPLTGRRDDIAGREDDLELHAATIKDYASREPRRVRRKLPFRRIWTRNLLFTLLSHGLLAMHVGTFSNLWFVFLSTPRYSPHPTQDGQTLRLPANYHPRPPFTFTGGLALPPPSIGLALSILGIIGITLQLLLYPPLSLSLGPLKSYRLSLLLFPLAYALAPFLALIPSTTPAPGQASGIKVWIAITLLLTIQVLARTFALPSTAILVNNSCPHPSVLGTVHGIGQSVSSGARTLGPVLGSWGYAMGLEWGVVGFAWWILAGVAVVGIVASGFVREGSGWEVILEGEEGVRAEEGRRN